MGELKQIICQCSASLLLSWKKVKRISNCVCLLITVTFLLVCMGMTSFSAVASVFTLRMHHGMFLNAPPGWLKRVTACTFGHNAANVKNNSHSYSVSTEENLWLESPSMMSSLRTSTQNATTAIPESRLQVTIDRLLADVEKLRKQVDSREPEDHVTIAWRRTARAFDMLCFWIFMILLVVMAIAVFCISLTLIWDYRN